MLKGKEMPNTILMMRQLRKAMKGILMTRRWITSQTQAGKDQETGGGVILITEIGFWGWVTFDYKNGRMLQRYDKG